MEKKKGPSKQEKELDALLMKFIEDVTKLGARASIVCVVGPDDKSGIGMDFRAIEGTSEAVQAATFRLNHYIHAMETNRIVDGALEAALDSMPKALRNKITGRPSREEMS